MSNVFVQQPAIQKLLRDSAGLDVAGGDERFKAIIHRLLENICTLIDDYNVTEEEFWHAVNYLHELGGRRGGGAAGGGSGTGAFPRSAPGRHRRGSASGNRHPAHHRRAAVRG